MNFKYTKEHLLNVYFQTSVKNPLIFLDCEESDKLIIKAVNRLDSLLKPSKWTLKKINEHLNTGQWELLRPINHIAIKPSQVNPHPKVPLITGYNPGVQLADILRAASAEEEDTAPGDQVGGTHYGDKDDVFDFSLAREHDCLQHSAIKYIDRHKLKNGEEDIRKAISVLERILQEQYSK